MPRFSSPAIVTCLTVLFVFSAVAQSALIITDSTNITLANAQTEVGGDTTDNPNVVNMPVGLLIPYTASASNGVCCGATFDLSNLNDGDIGVGVPSDGTYAIPNDGTLTLSFGATRQVKSIAIYDGYGNRDNGTYLLEDAAMNTLGGWTIAGTGGATNNGVDSFWLVFNQPVTTTALRLTFDVAAGDNNTASFREIQVFQAIVPEPASLSLVIVAGLALGRRRRRAC